MGSSMLVFDFTPWAPPGTIKKETNLVKVQAATFDPFVPVILEQINSDKDNQRSNQEAGNRFRLVKTVWEPVGFFH